MPDVPHVVEIFCIADTQTACSVIPQESNVLYVPNVVEIFHLKMFLTTNQIFAGRSARRRMYHGNQYSP